MEPAGGEVAQSVWVFAEHDGRELRNITLEMLSEARRLAERLRAELCACLLGDGVGHLVPALGMHGATRVHLVEHASLARYGVDAWTAHAAALIAARRPAIVMFGDTPTGAELAPRVAARLGLPCVTGVKKITVTRGRVQLSKSVYDDHAYATVQPVQKRPLVLTLPAGETDIVPAPAAQDPEVVRPDVVPEPRPPRTAIRRVIPGDPRTIAIEDAERIVAVGKGAGIEGLPALQEFAELLGAALGGSRVAADAGLVPRERQIGVSGRTVRPKLLIACGISGARQFTMGMENSECVIAVNLDEKAGIFEFANLRVRGDLREVIPAVIQHLRERMGPAGEADSP